MGCLMCKCCFDVKVEKNVLFAGRSLAGKSHTLYQMMGQLSALQTKVTPVFNNEIVNFRKYNRKFEFWDPSGAPDAIQFWESLYKNIAFDVVIYVLDARNYWVKEKRVESVRDDRMELHTLLCAPELNRCKFILYLNWKTQLELGDNEKNMLEAIPDELELYNFPKREIIVVDTFEKLEHALLTVETDGEGDEAAAQPIASP